MDRNSGNITIYGYDCAKGNFHIYHEHNQFNVYSKFFKKIYLPSEFRITLTGLNFSFYFFSRFTTSL